MKQIMITKYECLHVIHIGKTYIWGFLKNNENDLCVWGGFRICNDSNLSKQSNVSVEDGCLPPHICQQRVSHMSCINTDHSKVIAQSGPMNYNLGNQNFNQKAGWEWRLWLLEFNAQPKTSKKFGKTTTRGSEDINSMLQSIFSPLSLSI